MTKLLLSLSTIGFILLAGCEDKKKVEVNTPAVQVKTGDSGTEVKAPGTEVDVKK